MVPTEPLWQRLIRALEALRTGAAPRKPGVHTRPVQARPARPVRPEHALQAGAAAPVRLVSSRPLFALAPELLASLRATRPFCDYEDRVSWELDSFRLDPGGDEPCYLSADGRLCWVRPHAARAPTRADVFAALVAGAKHTGVSGLLALLPARSAHAETCAPCAGSGFRRGAAADAAQVCEVCAGLGWSAPELDLQAPAST